MPALAVPVAIALALAQQGAGKPTEFRIDGELVVQARTALFSRATGNAAAPDRMEFRDGVRAVYAGDVLTADSLVLFPLEKRGEATGRVTLTAMEGTLSAENLAFSWAPENRRASASDIRLETGGVLLRGARLETIPGNPPTLVLHDVEGTTCGDERRPAIAIRSPRIEFVPGKRGSMLKPELHLFGRKIVTLPTQKFNLDPRVGGLAMPSVYYRRNKGLGIRWASSVLIDDQTAASGDAQYFPNSPFTLDLSVTRSYLEPQRSNSLITPRSELEERFHESYLQSVAIKTPFAEDTLLSGDRRTLSLASSLNHGTRNDRSSDRYSKAIEAIYEVGGPWNRMGYQASIRLQHIRRNSESFHPRAVAFGTLSLGSHRLLDSLYVRGRLDQAAFVGETSFGWARFEGSLVAAPTPWLLLGAGYVFGEESGEAMFPADRLPAKRALVGRLDANLGPTKVSYLWKKNLDTRELLTEYTASQIVGCAEVFVSHRDFPSSFEIGLKLRMDDFLNRLKSRDQRRKRVAVPVDPRIGPASGFAPAPIVEPMQHP